jgi:hypothetical protein
LRITCYIDREVRQVYTFAELKTLEKKNGGIYFIYDSKFLDIITKKDRKVFLKEIRPEIIYSKKYKSRRRGEGEIIIGKMS